ncbi:hypothetical protein KC344_g102 [Hortaea werneckii]|nr:hypothetical protein KC344_g102 [Hortaea werneckii]
MSSARETRLLQHLPAGGIALRRLGTHPDQHPKRLPGPLDKVRQEAGHDPFPPVRGTQPVSDLCRAEVDVVRVAEFQPDATDGFAGHDDGEGGCDRGTLGAGFWPSV